VTLIGGPGAGKHKVFWVQPCPSTTSPTPSGSKSMSSPPSVSGAGGGALPITGASVTGIAGLGALLVAGGAALVFLRRRRDNTSTE
jgi:LPXTG-motif cell wall-anchored protein